MRTALMAVMVACSAPVPPPVDATPAVDGPAADAALNCSAASFQRPFGCACDFDVSVLCAGGLGFCWDGTCRHQCSDTGDYPRCPDGQHEEHRPFMGGDECTCAPD